MNDIYVIWADRGEYDDRVEYAVGWFTDEAKARRYAARLTIASAEWRLYCKKEDFPGNTKRLQEARAALGDSRWNEFDRTEYTAATLSQLSGNTIRLPPQKRVK